jgi:hypothetical protein
MRTNFRVTRRLLPLLLVAAIACSSTTLVNLWKDPTLPQQPLRNVLVVTLRKDPVSRRLWEDGFVASMRRHGVTATPSYQLFPSAPPDTTSLAEAVRGRGYDALLIAHELSASTETRYVPGYLTAQPVSYISPWTGHYYTYYARVYAPGYVENNLVVRYEADVLMTGNGGRLIWTGTTESVNPASSRSVTREIAHAIVPELVKSGVLRSQ